MTITELIEAAKELKQAIRDVQNDRIGDENHAIRLDLSYARGALSTVISALEDAQAREDNDGD